MANLPTVKRFVTADHHFGHENIIKFCNRPFDSVEKMDSLMIERWNRVVGKHDIVYHLGDFTLRGWDYFLEIQKQLNGTIIFIPGGHDWRWMKEMDLDEYVKKNIVIMPPLYSLEIDVDEEYPLVIVLCHYAMRVWDRSHYGSYHLYGHSHGNLEGLGKSMDVGVDTNSFYPYLLSDVLEKLDE